MRKDLYMNIPHKPVLLNEVVNSFKSMGDKGYFVDCTLGYAGHSSAILETYTKVNLVGIDRDSEALNFSRKRLEVFQTRVELRKGKFSHIFDELEHHKIAGILADFGVSSLQLDKKERGFSFKSETLDMRMDMDDLISAYHIVNNYSFKDLTLLFTKYGEIREIEAKRIASAIINHRLKEPIESGKVLADIISSASHDSGKIHPATLAFQAIRIEVNSELKEIESLLQSVENRAKKGELKGLVLSLITFHSLEDRLVKEYFKKWTQNCICPVDAFRCECGNNNSLGKKLTKRPIMASEIELQENVRSRSAKLRTFKFKG
jgi:16S rRNA (cytosine1402-N4)-methyltransferase